jgi:hypothetical protein
MLCSIDDYFLADGTKAGGYSLTSLRLKMERVFDVVIPLATVNPKLYDRNKRKVDITFNVQRVQTTIKAAENFCNIHEATIPRTGDIKLITSGTETVVALIINGALVTHELTKYTGKFTEHSYHIIGAPIFAPDPETSAITTEGGDRITTEAGDTIVVE